MYRALLVLALILTGCGESDDDTHDTAIADSDATTGGGAALTCDELCTNHGYDSFTEDVQQYEYHCFCEGGSGTDIDPTVCNDLCLELDWSGGYVEPAECWCA